MRCRERLPELCVCTANTSPHPQHRAFKSTMGSTLKDLNHHKINPIIEEKHTWPGVFKNSVTFWIFSFSFFFIYQKQRSKLQCLSLVSRFEEKDFLYPGLEDPNGLSQSWHGGPQSPQHLATPRTPLPPSPIRGKVADATVSHSGDSCTQGRCDVPPGPPAPFVRNSA